MINAYYYDDIDAPVMNGTPGTFLDVLDACLVTGYGSKAGAGWTKEYYDAANHIAVYKQGLGSNGIYLRVEDPSYNIVSVQAYANISGTLSSTAPENEPFHDYGSRGGFMKSNKNDNTSVNWSLYATEKFFYVFCGHVDNTQHTQNMFYFGDYNCVNPNFKYNTLLGIGYDGSYANYQYYYNPITTGNGGGFLWRGARQVNDYVRGRLITPHSCAITPAQLGYDNYFAYPNPLDNSLIISPVGIIDDDTKTFMGYMPGLYVPQHRQPFQAPDSFTVSGTVMSGTDMGIKLLYLGQVFIQTSGDW